MAINIPSLFRDVIETPEQRQQRQMLERLSQAQSFMAPRGSVAALANPLAGATFMNIAESQARVKENLGGMLGLDMRDSSQKLSDALMAGDPNTPEGLRDLSKQLQNIFPAQSLGLLQAAAEQEQIAEDRETARKELERQINLDERQETRADENLGLQRQRLNAELERLDLAVINAERQNEIDKTRMSVLEQQVENERQRIENNRADLSVATTKRQEELLDEYNTARRLVSNADRTADTFANLKGGGGRSGFVARGKEGLNRLLGSNDPLILNRTQLNEIRIAYSIDSLPPGVASDKDIQLVLSGTIDEYANPALIERYLRGVAKIQAITAEEKRQGIDYIGEKGNRTGYIDEWNKMQNSQPNALQEFKEGQSFADYMEGEYGIKWNFEEETSETTPNTTTSDEEQLNTIISHGVRSSNTGRGTRGR